MLAFDLGASSGKIFVGTYDGNLLSVENVCRFENTAIAVRDELFWDVLAIFQRLKEGIALAQQYCPVSSIGIDSFSNDFALLDKRGFLVSQTHSYRDSRTKRNEDFIHSRISKKELHQITGNQYGLFSTFMQLAAMTNEDQDYLLKGAGTLLKLPDLFTYFLTGSKQCEYTLASVSQLMNITSGEWATEVLDRFSISSSLLPPIILPGVRVGKFDTQRDPIEMVAVCEHDTASAFLASPVSSDAILISSGTWSLIGVETQTPIINDFTFQHNIANEGGFPGHHRILKNVMGHWLIQECCRWYNSKGLEYTFEELLRLASLEPTFANMIDPDDEIFFAPGDIPNRIEDYCRQRCQPLLNSPGKIIRCILESLAFKYRYVIEELETLLGCRYSKINIIGGGSKNTALNQMVANATNRPVYAGPFEATALGNIIVQLIAFGEIATISEGRELISHSFSIDYYEPENHIEWETKYQDFLNVLNKKKRFA